MMPALYVAFAAVIISVVAILYVWKIDRENDDIYGATELNREAINRLQKQVDLLEHAISQLTD